MGFTPMEKRTTYEHRHPSLVHPISIEDGVVDSEQVSLTGFSLGITAGWNSPASEMIKEALHLPYPNEWVVSVLSLSAASSMIAMAFSLNLLGRKLVMLLLVPPYIAAWLVLAFVNTIPLYCLGRLLIGFCAGAYSAATPIFIAEIAQRHIRGRLATFIQLFQVCGVTYAYIVGCFATNVRDLSLICMIPIIIFGVIFPFLPETPYFYRMKRNFEKETASLQWYRGRKYDLTEELDIIDKFIEKSEELNKVSFKKKFLSRTARKSLIIGIGLLSFQQLSGKSTVAMYMLTIFKASNSFINAHVCSVTSSLVDIIATMSAMFIIDRAGRKILLLISLSTTSLIHVILGVYFYYLEKNSETMQNFSWAPLLLLCLFSLSYSIGLGPVPATVISELFAQDIKAKACTICFFFRWLMHFLSPFAFPKIVFAIGYGYTFCIYASINALALLFVYFVCIETKQRTFQEIQDELMGKK